MSEANKQQPSEELTQADYQVPPDHSHLDRVVRLELLVGHLADLLTPARELISQLRLRANAGHATRSDLIHLNELNGDTWKRLGLISEELEELRAKRFESGRIVLTTRHVALAASKRLIGYAARSPINDREFRVIRQASAV